MPSVSLASKPLPEEPAQATPLPSPTLSREPSVIRGRGWSSSGIRPTPLHHQNSLRTASPHTFAPTDDVLSLRSSPESRSGLRRSSNTAAPVRVASATTDLVRVRSHTGVPAGSSSFISTTTRPYGDLNNHAARMEKGTELVRVASNEPTLATPTARPDPHSHDRTPTLASSSIFRSFSEGAGSASAHKRPDTDGVRVEQLKRESRLRSHSQLSTHQSGEAVSVGEFALNHLFDTFEQRANRKVESISRSGMDQQNYEPFLDQLCGPGVDVDFDQLLSALSHIVRARPKPLIDRMMQWRQKHNEPKSIASPTSSPLTDQHSVADTASTAHSKSNHPAGVEAVVAERKSLVSTYILCRAMIEIFRYTTFSALTIEYIRKLESIVYTGQLRSIPRDVLERSPMKLAKWNIASQLMGVMAELDFEGVSSHFIADLKKFHSDIGVKGYTNNVAEDEAVLTMKSMRYIRLQSNTDEAWARSCNFMNTIADLFASVHGRGPKLAYSQLIGQLILPLAGNFKVNFDHHIWRRLVRTLNTRFQQLATKPKYWQIAFSIQAIVVCASPYDIFMQKWQDLLVLLASKLRERNNRASVLKATCRMVWTYTERSTYSHAIVASTLKEVGKTVFHSGKKYSLSGGPAVVEPLIQLLRIIAYKDQDVCFRTIIFPLINVDLLVSIKQLSAESLDPDRMVVGIRAFLAILDDLETHEKPSLPLDFEDELVSDLMPPTIADRPPTRSASSHADRFPKPVDTTNFSEIAKASYAKFCESLGRLLLICDHTFGGHPFLDKDSTSSVPPKTPIGENWAPFPRKDDTSLFGEDRHRFYDLLHVAIVALPRCHSSHAPVNGLIPLLCSCTSHVNDNIAFASAKALTAIARQGNAQMIATRFSIFVSKHHDPKHGVLPDGGMRGPEHIEATLKLFIALLDLWLQELKHKAVKAEGETAETGNNNDKGFEKSSWETNIDRVESQGLYFLCSPSPRVRALAVDVLELVAKLDAALKQDNPRIITILQGGCDSIMDFNDESLSVHEKLRLQKDLRQNEIDSTLIQLCRSTSDHDMALWYKVFPKLIKTFVEKCPMTVTQTREDVCSRLSQTHSTIQGNEEGQRPRPTSPHEHFHHKTMLRQAPATLEVSLEQWKIWLVFACSTLTRSGEGSTPTSQEANHIRKSSRSSQTTQDSFDNATDLFAKVIPMLSSHNSRVRSAAVTGLGSVNINLYKPLLEALEASSRTRSDESRRRPASQNRMHSRITSPRRQTNNDNFRTEVAHVYKLTTHLLNKEEILNDEWILEHLGAYTKTIYLFLQHAENDQAFQRLRVHYCGLVEGLFKGISKTREPSRWMSFQTRRAAFTLLEEWCGFSSHGAGRQHQSTDRVSDFRAHELERNELRIAALSAMATLCAGPIVIQISGRTHQFDALRMLVWIDRCFNTPSHRTHATARRALKNLILHNKQYSYLLERSIETLFLATTAKALESYIEVISDIFMSEEAPVIPYWMIISALLFVLGDEESKTRMKAARLLRFFDDRQSKKAKLQDLDISISDKTTAVYKKAQFEISQRLALQHPELAFHVFAEFAKHFKEVHADNQRNMVLAILPWIKTVNLQLDPMGGPTPMSYMLMVNLFEITVKCSTSLHHEIQALWQALATGPYAGNVQLIVDFVIDLSLSRKSQNFVPYAKQVIVFLSTTPAGQKVIDFLLLQIGPRTMAQDKRDFKLPLIEPETLPYLADLTSAVPIGPKQAIASLGQLSLILLVDLIVAPVQLPIDKIPALLQVVVVLWDHHTDVVQEQAHEMLVHLIHELVISRLDDEALAATLPAVEELIELIRRRDAKVVWTYEENRSLDGKSPEPDSMTYVVSQAVKLLSLTHPNIQQAWGSTALIWATNCPVQHLACRSLQVYRSILEPLDQKTLSDLLARLSVTLADQGADIQAYSLELIRTFHVVVDRICTEFTLLVTPLFWTICACLDSVHEREFVESLTMLNEFMDRIDLSDTTMQSRLLEDRPRKWEWSNDGLSGLVYKGCKSGLCMEQSLRTLDRLLRIPSSPLIGDGTRVLFTLLVNLPRFSYSLRDPALQSALLECCMGMRTAAEAQGFEEIAKLLLDYEQNSISTSREFMKRSVATIKTTFFPKSELQVLMTFMGLLSNSIPWCKTETLQILQQLIPGVDLRRPDISSQGPDLYEPLLALLETEYCAQTLGVLDSVMAASGAPGERLALPLGVPISAPPRLTRKELDNNKYALYGKPDESGWAVPLPAVRRDLARANVYEVFSAFADSPARGTMGASPSGVEFYKEEYHHGPYFPDRTATMTSDEATLADTNMGELVSKLDSLDDFFDSIGPERNGSSSGFSFNHSYSGTPPGTLRENPFDSRASSLMRPSFSRNTSVNSFQSTYNDRRPTPARERAVMSPSAFTVSPKRPARPGMHNRSITSPQNVPRAAPERSFTISSDETEPFSDDDVLAGRTSTSDASFVFESTLRANQRARLGFRSGMRSGFKRLTGAADKRAASLKVQLERPPDAPKSPNPYLQNPKSADL